MLNCRFDGLTALVSEAAGKTANLMVLAGNQTKNINDSERVETVLKEDVGDQASFNWLLFFLLFPLESR